MANVNLFSTAKVVEKKTAAAKAEAPKVLIEGLEDLATVRDMIAALKGIEALYLSPVTDFCKEYGAKEASETKKAPVNFKAMEGDAEGSVQFRKRSSASALNETQIALLDKYGISHKTVSDVPETYIFNPDQETQDWIAKNGVEISKALMKIKGCPEGVLQKQVATTKEVTTENSVLEMAKLPFAAIREVFDVVITVAVGPHLANEDGADMEPKDILKKLTKLFR